MTPYYFNKYRIHAFRVPGRTRPALFFGQTLDKDEAVSLDRIAVCTLSVAEEAQMSHTRVIRSTQYYSVTYGFSSKDGISVYSDFDNQGRLSSMLLPFHCVEEYFQWCRNKRIRNTFRELLLRVVLRYNLSVSSARQLLVGEKQQDGIQAARYSPPSEEKKVPWVRYPPARLG